jgi:hypothetical protein
MGPCRQGIETCAASRRCRLGRDGDIGYGSERSEGPSPAGVNDAYDGGAGATETGFAAFGETASIRSTVLS